MIRRTWNWISKVLPPPPYLIACALVIAVIEGVYFSVLAMASDGGFLDSILRLRDHTLLFAVLIYGCYRVPAFHPLYRSEYFDWLKTTPWRRGSPLPLGPVRIVWQDLLLVALVAVALSDPRTLSAQNQTRESGMLALLIFLQSYTVNLSAVLWLTWQRSHAYTCLFLLAAAVRLSWTMPIVAWLVLCLAVAIAHFTLHRSWNTFPWDSMPELFAEMKARYRASLAQRTGTPMDRSMDQTRPSPEGLGWPFGCCSPHTTDPLVGTRDRMAVAGLIGFWLHAMLAGIPNREFVFSILALALGYLTIAVTVNRLFIACAQHRPPINLWGRIRTMRWIIPAYDVAFLNPIGTVLTAVAGITVNWYFEFDSANGLPITITLTLWASILIGPRLSDWKLTAPCRIVAGQLSKTGFEQLS